MLHVFWIHSPIVEKVAAATIKEFGLNENECRWLHPPNFTPIGNPKGVQRIEFNLLPAFPPPRINFIQSWINITLNSLTIKSILGKKEFFVYVPNPNNIDCQQLIHHPLCAGYYIIEEGVGSYLRSKQKQIFNLSIKFLKLYSRNLYRSIRTLFRIRPSENFNQVWPEKYMGCVGSHPASFPSLLESRKILSHQIFSSVSNHGIDHLLLIENLEGGGFMSNMEYLMVLKKYLKENAPRTGQWAFKFHHANLKHLAFCDAVRRIICGHCESHPPVDLTPATCIEEIGSSPGVKSYCIISSAGFYIQNNRGNVIWLTEYFVNNSKSFAERFSHLPLEIRRLINQPLL